MAYKKKLATIIITTLDGGTFNVADTLECPAATSALASLQNSNGAYVKVGDDTYYIPSSAVANIQVTYTDSEEIEKADPYGCESGDSDTMTVTLGADIECHDSANPQVVKAYEFCVANAEKGQDEESGLLVDKCFKLTILNQDGTLFSNKGTLETTGNNDRWIFLDVEDENSYLEIYSNGDVSCGTYE